MAKTKRRGPTTVFMEKTESIKDGGLSAIDDSPIPHRGVLRYKDKFPKLWADIDSLEVGKSGLFDLTQLPIVKAIQKALYYESRKSFKVLKMNAKHGRIWRLQTPRKSGPKPKNKE